MRGPSGRAMPDGGLIASALSENSRAGSPDCASGLKSRCRRRDRTLASPPTGVSACRLSAATSAKSGHGSARNGNTRRNRSAVTGTSAYPARRSRCLPSAAISSRPGRANATRSTSLSALQASLPGMSGPPPASEIVGTISVAASGQPPRTGGTVLLTPACRPPFGLPRGEAVLQVADGDPPVERIGGQQHEWRGKQNDPQPPPAPHLASPRISCRL